MKKTINFLQWQSHEKFPNQYKMIDNNQCLRCGNTKIIHDNDTYYCFNCRELGLITSETYFYQDDYQYFDSQKYHFVKDYQLTNLQQKASDFIINNTLNNKDMLIWAVCGAGKTEITFDVIYQTLIKGEYIAFAITRVDIVYEIYERLKEVFTNANIAVLTGERKEKYSNAQIFILTTNQMLKFHNAFSLIIIDEVDAFPFEYNHKFDYAINNSKRKNSSVIYLTSTPSNTILEKNLEIFKIYKRWHNYDLPVPKLKKLSLSFINSKLIHPKLYYHLKKSNRQCLIFISNINSGKKLNKLLNIYNLKSEFTYSSDSNKSEKIKNFKNCKYNYLISTTILERGITFNDIDVFIIDSSSQLYNIAALVQIAGRARRKKEYQGGNVIFFYQEITFTIDSAIKQINHMNDLKNSEKTPNKVF